MLTIAGGIVLGVLGLWALLAVLVAIGNWAGEHPTAFAVLWVVVLLGGFLAVGIALGGR